MRILVSNGLSIQAIADKFGRTWMSVKRAVTKPPATRKRRLKSDLARVNEALKKSAEDPVLALCNQLRAALLKTAPNIYSVSLNVKTGATVLETVTLVTYQLT